MNLLPIIRRKRRPLTPIDEPRVVPQPISAEVNKPEEKSESNDSDSEKTSTAADVVGD